MKNKFQEELYCQTIRNLMPILVQHFFLFHNKKIPMEKHTWRKATTLSQNTPSARWGHASTLVDRHLVLFGGYADSQYRNDLWSYDTASMIWTEIQTQGEIPAIRSNATLHFHPEGKQLILFGGGGPNKSRYNDVCLLDWETKNWTRLLPPQGENSPWERTYHSSQLLYPYLFVFGGEGIADLEDLWAFDLLQSRWREIKIDRTKGRPSARRFHSSALIGTKMLIIAGCHDKYRCLSDVHQIDLSPFLQDPNHSPPLHWKEIQLKGASFLSRWGHSSSVLEGKVYIFGGRFSSDLQDILLLDPERQTLKSMKVHGELPKARRRHSGNFVGSSLLVFGGFNGQYFNDLNHINLFELPHRRLEINTQEKRIIGKWINRRLLADFQVKTKENDTFYFHKGLIIDKFVDKCQFQDFVSSINGKHSLLQLYDLFQILYSGIGDISQIFELQHISFNLFETQHEKQANFIHFLTGQPFQTVLIAPKTSQTKVIPLSTDVYSNFLESRSNLYSDFWITLKEQYSLPANKTKLALSSTYFQYLLQNDPHNNELKLHLPQQTFGDVRIFQVLINYLQKGWIIVPQALDQTCWMKLMHLAEYFCIAIRNECEAELILCINTQNCEKMLQFSLKQGLQDLQKHCLELILKLWLQQDKKQRIKFIINKKNRSQTETALYNFYKLWQFDIQQYQLSKKQPQNSKNPNNSSSQFKQNVSTLSQ